MATVLAPTPRRPRAVRMPPYHPSGPRPCAPPPIPFALALAPPMRRATSAPLAYVPILPSETLVVIPDPSPIKETETGHERAHDSEEDDRRSPALRSTGGGRSRPASEEAVEGPEGQSTPSCVSADTSVPTSISSVGGSSFGPDLGSAPAAPARTREGLVRRVWKAAKRLRHGL